MDYPLTTKYVQYKKPKGSYTTIEEYVAASIAQYGEPVEHKYKDIDLDSGKVLGKGIAECVTCGNMFTATKFRKRFCRGCSGKKKKAAAAGLSIVCQVCGKSTPKRGSTQLYCPPCSKIKRKQRDSERHKRNKA